MKEFQHLIVLDNLDHLVSNPEGSDSWREEKVKDTEVGHMN